MMEHISSTFDNYEILLELPPKQRVVDLIIYTGKGILSMEKYNGKVGVRSDKELNYLDNEAPQFSFFLCSSSHLKISPKELGKTIGLTKNCC